MSAKTDVLKWRELCRRLYVELSHCYPQMLKVSDEDGDSYFQRSAHLEDVLHDAGAALGIPASPYKSLAKWGDPAANEWMVLSDKLERALAELIDKIEPGLDTGDILADAATAGRNLDTLYAAPQPQQEAPQQPAEGVPADPMDMRLPCDVKVGHGTHGKGTTLRSLVGRMQWMYDELNRLYAEQLDAPAKPQGGWVCPKCGTDRTKAGCPRGVGASLTGDCPMVGHAQSHSTPPAASKSEGAGT